LITRAASISSTEPSRPSSSVGSTVHEPSGTGGNEYMPPAVVISLVTVPPGAMSLTSTRGSTLRFRTWRIWPLIDASPIGRVAVALAVEVGLRVALGVRLAVNVAVGKGEGESVSVGVKVRVAVPGGTVAVGV
jgi:hypothetical protein